MDCFKRTFYQITKITIVSKNKTLRLKGNKTQ